MKGRKKEVKDGSSEKYTLQDQKPGILGMEHCAIWGIQAWGLAYLFSVLALDQMRRCQRHEVVRGGNPQSRYVYVVDMKDILAHPKLWLAFGALTILVFQYKTYFLSQELRI